MHKIFLNRSYMFSYLSFLKAEQLNTGWCILQCKYNFLFNSETYCHQVSKAEDSWKLRDKKCPTDWSSGNSVLGRRGKQGTEIILGVRRESIKLVRQLRKCNHAETLKSFQKCRCFGGDIHVSDSASKLLADLG